MGNDYLQGIFERQLALQRQIIGHDPRDLEPELRLEYASMMALALTDEIHEALGEIGWKPWAKSRHFNEDAFGHELVDALHFLVNLFIAAGWTADEVVLAYFVKANINSARQEAGYTGLEKCPSCGRALDDVAVKCTAERCEYEA